MYQNLWLTRNHLFYIVIDTEYYVKCNESITKIQRLLEFTKTWTFNSLIKSMKLFVIYYEKSFSLWFFLNLLLCSNRKCRIIVLLIHWQSEIANNKSCRRTVYESSVQTYTHHRKSKSVQDVTSDNLDCVCWFFTDNSRNNYVILI